MLQLLAESDAAPLEHPAYDQRVFYKREAPFPGDAKLDDPVQGPADGQRRGTAMTAKAQHAN